MSPKKNPTEKYRKRRKKERANRAVNNRVKREAEFAERIRNEPPLEEIERTW